MRNLKKILALVLALVMSLSLMATASAADFKDADSISENYKTAVEVLEGLKVFKGYAEDNTFRPQGDITRAEVAAIIYRIATGDAEDKQAAIYTDMTTSFTDLNQAQWARGYVNYCHNAQIIKGESATKFNPSGKISGYATLAMILRAMGYGKNGEFEGKGWEYQTAAKAKEIGLIDNVIEAQLGSAAPRELVAEILFRALLTETVTYTALTGYNGTRTTLGQQKFGLEKITGVIMANQWANLESGRVLGVDTTRMNVTKNETIDGSIKEGNATLNIATDLEAVGLKYTVYISGKGSTKTVLTALEDAGNKVADNKGQAVGTNKSDQLKGSISDLAGSEGISLGDKTEWFVDYEQEWDVDRKSDIIIRYTVEEDSILKANTNYVSTATKNEWIKWLTTDAPSGTVTVEGTTPTRVFTRTMRPGTLITAIDQAIMQEIFYSADKVNANLDGWVRGEVYAGTETLNDKSDTMSWASFKETYFLEEKYSEKFQSAENGESLRVIDNDGNGVAEYVLKVQYNQDEVANVINDVVVLKNGTTGLKLDAPNYVAADNTLVFFDDVTVGDIVNWRLIDGQICVWKAKTVEDSIATKDWKTITVTTTGGEKKGQSGIANLTDLAQDIMNMDNNTKYVMYLDQYDYVRTYKLAQGSQYALITELYPTNDLNHNYITNNQLIAEVKIGDGDIANHVVANPNGNVFLSSYAWTALSNRYNTSNYNWLQPAIAHLGQLTDINKGQFMGATNTNAYTDWNRTVLRTIDSLTANSLSAGNMGDNGPSQPGDYGVFDYGTVSGKNYNDNAKTAVDHSFSFTNVAAYNLLDNDAITLNTAAQLLKTATGEQLYYNTAALAAADTQNATSYAPYIGKFKASTWATDGIKGKTFADAVADGTLAPVFKTDYIHLNAQNVAANTLHYGIDTNYSAKYHTTANRYVDATVNTEFYIVMPGLVTHFTGFAELPTIRADEVRATYAVATNTAKDVNDADYWIADVIVIEVNRLSYDFDSISLMYYNPFENNGSTRYVDSLNNQWVAYENANPMMQVVPTSVVNSSATVSWGNSTWNRGTTAANSDYGFYKLYRTQKQSEGVLSATDIEKITDNWNAYGIWAGYVTRVAGLTTSGYIDVENNNDRTDLDTHVWINYKDGSNYETPIYRISLQYANGVISANQIHVYEQLNVSDVQLNDRLIWVYNKDNSKLAYIVDLGTSDFDANSNRVIPEYLSSTYSSIFIEQVNGSSAPAYDNWTINFKVEGLTAAQQEAVGIKVPNVYVDKGTHTSEWLAPSYFNIPNVDGYTRSAASYSVAGWSDATNKTVGGAGSLSGYTQYYGITSDCTITITYVPDPIDVEGGTYTAGPSSTKPVVKAGLVGESTSSMTTLAESAGNKLTTENGKTVLLNISVPTADLTAGYEPVVNVKTTTPSAALPARCNLHETGTRYTDPTNLANTIVAYTFYIDRINTVTSAPAGPIVVDVTMTAKTWDVIATGDANVTTFSAVSGTDTSGETITLQSGTTAAKDEFKVVALTSTVTITPTVAPGYEIDAANVKVMADNVEVASNSNANWEVTGGTIVLKNVPALSGKNIRVTVATKLVVYNTINVDAKASTTAGNTGWGTTGEVEAWIVYADGTESQHYSGTNVVVTIPNANFTINDKLVVRANGATTDSAPTLVGVSGTTSVGAFGIFNPTPYSAGGSWTSETNKVWSTGTTIDVDVKA